MRARRRPFTTTLPDNILAEIDAVTRERRCSRGDIIAEALILWNKKRLQDKLAASYARATITIP